ncbi:hypothetical protein EKO25_26050 [Bacillus sp. SAJ1]|nr:hypothetical protein EKO25_26050 [Bacillus sp. SAJ1]
MYIVGTAVSSTNAAISYTDGLGVRKEDGKLFLTEYRAGSYDTSGKASGKVSQWGTKYLAENGKNYSYMLNYYYSGSTVVGGTGKTVSLFAY